MSPELKYTLVSWLALTVVGLIRLKTPAQWASFVDNSTRLAGFVKMARGAGFDVHAFVEGLAMLVLNQKPVEPAARAIEDAAAPLLIQAKTLPDTAKVFQWVAERRITAEQGAAWLVDGVEPVATNAPEAAAPTHNVTVVTTGSPSPLDVARQVSEMLTGFAIAANVSVVDPVTGKGATISAPPARRDKTPAEAEANAAPLPSASEPYPGHEVAPLPSVPGVSPLADGTGPFASAIALAPPVLPDLVATETPSVIVVPPIPAALDPRVQGLMKLMAAGKYAGRTTDEDLATIWGIGVAEVAQLVQEAASRSFHAFPAPLAATAPSPLEVPANVAPVVLTVQTPTP